MVDLECPLSAEHFNQINDRKWAGLPPDADTGGAHRRVATRFSLS
jgi:hypothetical protein